MLKIGLTGGIGSGKSTVSGILKEKGINVIDADKIARNVLQKYPDILVEINHEFGSEFFLSDGTLNRREFGNFIFSNENIKKQYENIILPYIFKDVQEEFNKFEKENEFMVVLDAPTLIETQMYKKMNKNILVWVDENTEISRVKKRDLLSNEEIGKRIKAQISLEEKKKYVDFVIDNSGDLLYTKAQIENILLKLGKSYA